MRVVVDTNVFVSAALKAQSLPAVAMYLVERRCVLLKSTATEEELLQVVARPHLAPFIAPAFRQWLTGQLAVAELVKITQPFIACRDPKDDKFLELAVNGQADVMLSGDDDLLTLDQFRGIPIVSPAAFVQLITP